MGQDTPGTWGPQDVWNLIWDWDYTPDPVLGQHRIGWKKLFDDFSEVRAEEVIFLITSCQNMVHETWGWTHRLSRTNNYEAWLKEDNVLRRAASGFPGLGNDHWGQRKNHSQTAPAIEMQDTRWRTEPLKPVRRRRRRRHPYPNEL